MWLHCIKCLNFLHIYSRGQMVLHIHTKAISDNQKKASFYKQHKEQSSTHGLLGETNLSACSTAEGRCLYQADLSDMPKQWSGYPAPPSGPFSIWERMVQETVIACLPESLWRAELLKPGSTVSRWIAMVCCKYTTYFQRGIEQAFRNSALMWK